MLKLFNRSDNSAQETVDVWLRRIRSPQTLRRYKAILGELTSHLNGLDLLLVKEAHVLSFLEWCRNRPGVNGAVSSQTVRAKAAILSKLYELFRVQGLVRANPFSLVIGPMRGSGGEVRPHSLIPKHHLELILNGPSAFTSQGKRDRALFALLLGAGLRISEAVALNVEDVRILNEDETSVVYIAVKKTKSGKPRTPVLSPDCVDAVLSLVTSRMTDRASESEPLLILPGSMKRKDRRMSTRQAHRIWKGWLKALKLPTKYTLHSCRATAISMLLEAGLSHREIQDWSGHSSITMVERYDKRRSEIKDSAGKKLRFM